MKQELDEKTGISAIIYLQSIAGLVETEEKARKGWHAMTQSQKELTVDLYHQFTNKEKKA